MDGLGSGKDKQFLSNNFTSQQHQHKPKVNLTRQDYRFPDKVIRDSSRLDKDSDRYVWETWMRSPNTTVVNSPDLKEIDSSNAAINQNYQQHQIKLGRSSVGLHHDKDMSINSMSGLQNLSQSGYHLPKQQQKQHMSDTRNVSGYDNMHDNWRRNKMSSPDLGAAAVNSSDDHRYDHYNQRDFDNLRYGNDEIDDCDDYESDVAQQKQQQSSKITKMIGAMPINDYLTSPRRIGTANNSQQQHYHEENKSMKLQQQQQQQQQPNKIPSQSLYLPRPGFPQRVLHSPADNRSPSNYVDSSLIDEGELKIDNGILSQPQNHTNTKETTFDYVYEFSETRKVLEEFFKCPNDDDKILSDVNESENGGSFMDLNQLDQQAPTPDHQYIGQRLAKIPKEEYSTLESPQTSGYYNSYQNEIYDNNEIELYLDSGSRSSGELADTELDGHNARRNSRNFTLSPETTDYDSNCGDLDSLSNDVNGAMPDFVRLYTSMPVLEDGLSSGHASDTENNNPISIVMADRKMYDVPTSTNKNTNTKLDSPNKSIPGQAQRNESYTVRLTPSTTANTGVSTFDQMRNSIDNSYNSSLENNSVDTCKMVNINENDMESIYSMNLIQNTSSPNNLDISATDVQTTLRDIKTNNMQRNQIDNLDETSNMDEQSPIWLRNENCHSPISVESEINMPSKLLSCDDEEADTDLETDRLLGQQRLDDKGYYDDKNWVERKGATVIKSPQNSLNFTSTTIRSGVGTQNTATDLASCNTNESNDNADEDGIPKSPTESIKSKKDKNEKSRNKEVKHDPAVLIEGVLFRAKYLGSTQLVCEGQPTKTTRMMQAEEAVSRIKQPEGETQPSTEVDLFISTEKIMVLNTDLKEIMMDHALRTISYIADIGDLVVLMARRRFVPTEMDDGTKQNRTPKMICHVFESEEAQFIAQSIGQAFQVAYMEFLKANGIEDHSFVKEMDYQEVLNSQEIFGDELEIFAKKELQKEVVVPKAKGEILGVVIVESGWGSMLPTVVLANLLSAGAAARCGQLNIGDQIIAINGLSLVGLPLSQCQNYIRNTKSQTAVKFTVVPCAPVVEVKIKRPNTKYQLGFSVQNGVICSLLRGGIAERGGVRVGHRIIEINTQSVVAVPHEKIVNLLATSVGEILMKTMPTSMFRLLTGQENPIYI